VTIALVFPGQGSQRIGMLDAFVEQSSLGRLFDAADALTGIGLRAIAAGGSPGELSDTRVAQPLLFLADWAWGSAAIKAGIVPAALAGHSLGEIAALALGGAFSVEAGLELVVERARLMADCAATAPGGMAAVLGLDAVAVQRTIAGTEGVWVANDNAPGQIVISGTLGGLAVATDALVSAGARRVVPLQVSGAFHTPLMAAAAEAFASILEHTAFADTAVPVYSNTHPEAATDAATLRARLATQIVSPVRWTDTMRALHTDGHSILLEAGPGSVLANLANRVEGLAAYSVEKDGIESVLAEGRRR
jgi:[acyl-carrier-protein] S-malonyltransferase